MRRNIFALILAMLFVVLFSSNVSARPNGFFRGPPISHYQHTGQGDLSHEATYSWEGRIDLSQQAGHLCNTGAQFEQRISGEGSMTKAKEVYMEEGVIVVSDTNDWVTAPDAIRNLTVTSAIKLCAPAKHWFDDTIMFRELLVRPRIGNLLGFPDMFPNNHPQYLEMLADSAYKPLTEQVWAVQVSADPGYSGQIDMAFEAAYSPSVIVPRPTPNGGNEWLSAEELFDSILFDFGIDLRHSSAWFESAGYDDWPGYLVQEMGPWFVGNYFNIEQFSRTSQGTHRRYIDISSPWSHGYLNEEMTVRGMSEVWEAFSMDNLTAGDEVGVLWWNLF